MWSSDVTFVRKLERWLTILSSIVIMPVNYGHWLFYSGLCLIKSLKCWYVRRRIVRWGVGVVWCAIPLCGVVWCAMPLCLLWMVWRERNRRAFEGLEWHSTGSKLFLMCPLHEWMVVSNHSSSTLLAFIDSYSLSKLCCLVYFLCTKGLIFIWQNYINIIKNYYL